ncbi:unnamed protein product [Ostreobium quekettii]|uniref:Uncharacterized protein n=1 Tax=Ostreobium quekettii TaxID=121088 RepID=A0A8S1J547_9CHLO|nr:unnamed protein product [Ostreobium quekettii]
MTATLKCERECRKQIGTCRMDKRWEVVGIVLAAFLLVDSQLVAEILVKRVSGRTLGTASFENVLWVTVLRHLLERCSSTTTTPGYLMSAQGYFWLLVCATPSAHIIQSDLDSLVCDCLRPFHYQRHANWVHMLAYNTLA